MIDNNGHYSIMTDARVKLTAVPRERICHEWQLAESELISRVLSNLTANDELSGDDLATVRAEILTRANHRGDTNAYDYFRPI